MRLAIIAVLCAASLAGQIQQNTSGGSGGAGTITLAVSGTFPNYTAVGTPTFTGVDGTILMLPSGLSGGVTCDGSTTVTLTIDGLGPYNLERTDDQDTFNAPGVEDCEDDQAGWIPLTFNLTSFGGATPWLAIQQAQTTLTFLSSYAEVYYACSNPITQTGCLALGGTYYQTVETAGSALPQEPAINFTSGVTCTDDPTNTRTNCAVSGGGGYTPFANFTAPVNSGWSQLNWSGATSVAFSGGVAAMTTTGSGNPEIRGYIQSLPGSAPWTVIMAVIVQPGLAGLAVGSVSGGWNSSLILTDGTKVKEFAISRSTGSTSTQNIYIQINNWTNTSTFGAQLTGPPNGITPPVFWFKVHNDGTNFTYWYSIDPTNVGWQPFYTEATNSFLTPTSAGFAIQPYGSDLNQLTIIGDAVVSWAITTP